MNNQKFKLFFTAFMQTVLISANTFFIAKGYIPGLIVGGFFISYIWTYNVKKIAISTHPERILYSLGAMFGTIFGFFLAQKILILTLFT